MLIFFALKQIIANLIGLAYVNAIWIIGGIVVLSLFGSAILGKVVKGFGAFASGVISAIPFRSIGRGIINLVHTMYKWLHKCFSRILPNWAATLLAIVILVII